MKRDIAWRLGGMLALIGAAGSSLLHRTVFLAHAHGSASALELGLGLTSFVLASFGILLLLRGASLRDGWTSDCENAVDAAKADLRPSPHKKYEEDRQAAIVVDPTAFAGERSAVGMILADRAIRAAATTRDRAIPPSKYR